jgi:hypothetical protein
VRDIDVSEGIVPLGEFKSKASKIAREIALKIVDAAERIIQFPDEATGRAHH